MSQRNNDNNSNRFNIPPFNGERSTLLSRLSGIYRSIGGEPSEENPANAVQQAPDPAAPGN